MRSRIVGVTGRDRRRRRIRAKIQGTAERPRLNVFRSAKHTYAQLINDEAGLTVVSASTLEKRPEKAKKSEHQTKTSLAHVVGNILAEKAKEKKIKNVVFDRGGYKYHGRVAEVATGAREAGLVF